jgi:hypothetical protein
VAGGWSLSAPPLPPWSAGGCAPLPGALEDGAGFGRTRPAEPAERCLAPAVGQPLAGQAGPDPEDPEPEEPEEPPARPRTGVAGPDSGPGDAARGRDEAADRPAPRDQPEAGAPAPDRRGAAGAGPAGAVLADAGLADAGPADAEAAGLGAAGLLPPARAALARDAPRGGRSSGGAVRPLPPSASAAFLSRAEPAPPAVPASRLPVALSPSASTGGGASGRSRDA